MEKIFKPSVKPSNPYFSSGPCSKRPGWNIDNLKNSSIGRSHRSPECKNKLNDVIIKSKKILNIPDSYVLGIMPASDTGALEAALWSLLGFTGVDVLAWENFGNDWVIDIIEQLKIKNVNKHSANYGKIPNLKNINFANDVVFTWNGTTSGVCVPNANWIPNDRKGLTICDATSAVFAMNIEFDKLDVITWSWQKVLGGEAAHGMLALSPRAIKRLEEYSPKWPIPKIFRISKKNNVIKGIFEGSTINTPSMICVEDALDSLNWVESIGGNNELIKLSSKNLQIVNQWILKSEWIEFLNSDENTRSCTSITLKIKDSWFNDFEEDKQRSIIKKLVKLLEEEKVAFDINGYNKAPPSLRLWGGATVENENMENLLPWIDWAYNTVKSNA
ncbi:MAG: Phosphoserine aminotransferase [Alphaproteobacteria bacterium MarineAlpha5_Bin12]|nr:MAG: Phosphoserine aminotransferase [Alphaproteobacteria bacterium MarineAlpha5_Bin12]|tara:strand:- start:2643 stop:3806 length:1164 start_codon:yes stop_codon:yes gene_type:complete